MEKCDILCLTETHLSHEIYDAEIFIENFTIFRGDRNDNRDKGGSIIYVHNNITCSRLDSFDPNDSLAVLIDISDIQIVVACVYRSPSISYNDNIKMIDKFRSFKALISSGTEIVVVGDFNLPNVVWDSGSVMAPHSTKNKELIIQKKFIDVFQDTGLYWQLNDGTITRTRMYNGQLQESLLDQVLVSDPVINLQCEVKAPLGKSDHKVIMTKIRCGNVPGYTKSVRKCWGKISAEEIAEIGKNIDWTYEGKPNVEDYWEHISSRIRAITDKVPAVSVETSVNGATYIRAPWECSSLSRKRRAKDLSWHQFEECPTNDNLMYALEKSRELEHVLNKSMMKYENKMTRGMKCNPKSFYRYVNSKRKVKQSVVNVKTGSGHLAKSPKETADLLADFFESTFQKTGTAGNKYKLDSCEYIAPVGMDEVSKLLSDLNIYKTMGPDDVHAKILKSLSRNTSFLNCLQQLFNTCLTDGTIPQIWKKAKVTPIHKKGSKTEAKNYRPISLTSILCKVYEKIVRDRILTSVGNNISKYQHGFVKSKSCLSNLLQAADFIYEKLANDEPVDLFFLDFQKAFDTVPHDKLMTKLENIGLEKQLLSVISDFLSDRSFEVTVGNSVSGARPVRSGVPQGSVLGPILFILYINDMPENITNLLLLFADDAKMCANALNFSQTQLDLDRLATWQTYWGLTFNTIDQKCKVMHLGTRNPQNTYILNDQPLISTAEEKDLGIWTTNTYTWQFHIDSCIKKARSVMCWIMRVIISKRKELMLQLYKTLVRPHLEYCVQLWSPVPRHGNWGLIFKIEDVQRDFTRQIFELGHLCYKDRLTVLGLTTLVERRARGDLIETYKIYKGFANYGQELFRWSRNGCNILYPTGKRSKQQDDFLNTRVIENWNKLPRHVKDSPNIDSFKSSLESLKKTYMNSQDVTTANFWSLSATLLSKIDDTNREHHFDFLSDNPGIAKHKMTNIACSYD